MKDINVKYENNTITNIEDLELLNELYECKKKLEKKTIIPYITESDLIKLNDYESDTIYLRLIKEPNDLINNPKNSSTNDSIINIDKEHLNSNDKHKKHKRDKKIYSSENLKINIESPKKVSKSIESPKKVSKSIESPKKVSKSSESPQKVVLHISKILTKHIIINDVDYIIHYKTSNEPFSLFKIENNNNKINCIGALDFLIKMSELIYNNYDVKTTEYNMIKYNIISPKFDDFISPMFIEIVSLDLKYTIELFMDILPNIICNI
jgi:hypothetical protein